MKRTYLVATSLALAISASPTSLKSRDRPWIRSRRPTRLRRSLVRSSSRTARRASETAQKVYDTLDFTRALNVFNNSFRGASAYAIRKGFHSIGAEDNTVVIFPELMDAKSLFLTANADTVYYLAVLDLTKGPMVIEQPPKSLGTINDMWFSWIIDIGFPGPDRGEGGKYLIVPPGYDGPLPDGGFHVAHSKTNRVLYAARAFLEDNDPKPAVEHDQEDPQDLPLHAGRLRHQHRHGPRRRSSPREEPADSRDQVRRRERQIVQHDPAERLLASSR